MHQDTDTEQELVQAPAFRKSLDVLLRPASAERPRQVRLLFSLHDMGVHVIPYVTDTALSHSFEQPYIIGHACVLVCFSFGATCENLKFCTHSAVTQVNFQKGALATSGILRHPRD